MLVPAPEDPSITTPDEIADWVSRQLDADGWPPGWDY